MIFVREDFKRISQLSEEQAQSEMQEYIAWVEELAASGNFVGGDPLEEEGRWMTADTVQSDGPFIEAKEAISGYTLIRAENLDAAEAMARKCPIFKYGGVLEVRPIMKYG